MLERFSGEPITLLQFDLDGTLIDSVPQLAKAVNGALVDCELPVVALSQVAEWIGNGADMLLRRAWARNSDPGMGPSSALFNQLRQAFDRHYHAGLDRDFSLYPDVMTTLMCLRQTGVKMAIVTNKPHPFVMPLLQASGLAGLFDYVLGGDLLPQRKPDPAPLLHICEQLRVSPANSLMIGDSRSDILAARAARMRCVGLTYGYNHGEPIANSAPDRILDHFSQLTDLLLVSDKD